MTSGKILIDENLSRRLVPVVAASFPGSTHVSAENLLQSADTKVWDFAKQQGYCILTKDWDFRFMSLTFGCPPKIIRLNCGNQTTNYIAELLRDKMEIILDFFDDDDLCYLEIE